MWNHTRPSHCYVHGSSEAVLTRAFDPDVLDLCVLQFLDTQMEDIKITALFLPAMLAIIDVLLEMKTTCDDPEI